MNHLSGGSETFQPKKRQPNNSQTMVIYLGHTAFQRSRSRSVKFRIFNTTTKIVGAYPNNAVTNPLIPLAVTRNTRL